MSRRWYLERSLDRDAAVISACADALQVLSEGPMPHWDAERTSYALTDCAEVIDKIDKSAQAQLGKSVRTDAFFYALSIALCRELSQPAPQLHESLSRAEASLRDRSGGAEVIRILQAVIQLSQRDVALKWQDLTSKTSLSP